MAKWAPPCACGGKSIGSGSYSRRIRLGELAEIVEFLVKRWRCKTCGHTFSHLPPFVLVLKRYAAALVQGVWQERVNGVPTERPEDAAEAERRPPLEFLTERWGLPCVVTVRRWLLPLEIHAQRIAAELRRLLPRDVKFDVEEQEKTSGERLLSLAQLATVHIPHHPVDRDRVPYHQVSHIVGRLQASNG